MASQFTVFVSHVSEDESIAIALKRLLETVFLNAQVFVAGRDLAGGEVWVKEIRDQLRVARVIISVITPFSRITPWVLFEAGAGFVDSRTIPVCADGVTVADLEPPLRFLQAREVSADGLRRLAADIARRAEVREPETLPRLDEALSAIDEFLRARHRSRPPSPTGASQKGSPAPHLSSQTRKKTDPELQAAFERVCKRIRDATIASIELARGHYDVPSCEELASMTQSDLDLVAECFNIPRPFMASLCLRGMGGGEIPTEEDSRWKKMNARKGIEEANGELDKFLKKISERGGGAEQGAAEVPPAAAGRP